MEALALIGGFLVLGQAAMLGVAWWFWRLRRRDLPLLDIARVARMARPPDDAVVLSDAEGRIVWVDPACARLTGLGLDRLRRMTLAELLRQSVQPGPRRAELDAALRARAALRVDLRCRRPGGEPRWMTVELHPLHEPGREAFIGWMLVQIDIDDTRREQERLQQALRDHENLNSIMDQHAIVSETDLQGCILRFNERFTHISGYAQGELLGLNHRLLNSGHHPIEFWQDMWATIGEGRIWRGEVCNRAKDGSLYWVDSVIAPLRGPDGLPERYVSVRTDITALKTHEALLRRTGKIAGVGGWHGDIHSDVLHFSEEARAILQLETEQMRVGDAMQRLSAQVAQELQANVDSLIHGQAQSFNQALTLVQPDGSDLWLRVSGEVELHNGQPYRLIGAVQDVSPYVRARLRIQAGERLLRSAFEALGEAFAVYDKHERLLFFNEKYSEILGPGRRAITTGLSFDTVARMLVDAGVYRSKADPQTQLREMRQMVEQPDFRYRVQLSTGRWVKYIGHATPDGLHVLFRIDITDIQEALQTAEAAARSKSRFLANMSHEIRTPMNAVIGLLQLLGQTALDAEQEDLLDKIGGAARTLLGILNDILDFSKIEAGKMPLDLEPFALDTLYAELSPILSGALGDKALELVYDIDPEIPPTLRGDMLRLKQVLMNLGGNAIKFTAQGQVLLRVRQLRRDERGALLEFAVQDTGIGISPRQTRQIFKGFSQAEASTSRRYGGTGLGLAISRRLVGLMVEACGEGRSLSVDSAVGRGSTFSFQLLLPVVAQGGEGREGEDEGEEGHEGAAQRTPTRAWLLAPALPAGEALARMLAGKGWQVQILATAAALQRQLETLDPRAIPDVALLDLDGPDAEACARVLGAWPADRGRPPDTLTMSAHALRGGIRSALCKPLTAGMVQALVQRRRAPTPQRTPVRAMGVQRLGGVRLLLVEDNLINQEVARRMLGREGAEVHVAENGQQALHALNAAPTAYDLVLMDMQMPVMDGLQATRAIRRQGAQAETRADARPGQARWLQLPIVAMTANAQPSDRQACLEAGMNDHIGKPFEQEQLIQLVLRHVRGQGVAADVPEAARPRQTPVPAGPEPALDTWPLLDVQGALTRLGADAMFYSRLLQDFALQGVGLCERIVAGEEATEGQEDAVGAAAHELKSMARTIGAMRLGELAARIERQARASVAGVAEPGAGSETGAGALAPTAYRAGLAALWTQTLAAQAQWNRDHGTLAQAAPMPKTGPDADHDRAQDWAEALETLARCLRANDMEALELVEALPTRLVALPVDAAQASRLQEALRTLQEAMTVFDTGRALTAVQALRTVAPVPVPDCGLEKAKH